MAGNIQGTPEQEISGRAQVLMHLATAFTNVDLAIRETERTYSGFDRATVLAIEGLAQAVIAQTHKLLKNFSDTPETSDDSLG